MGNKPSAVKNDCVDELTNTNEEDLDISNVDKLQIKAIKELSEETSVLIGRAIVDEGLSSITFADDF